MNKKAWIGLTAGAIVLTGLGTAWASKDHRDYGKSRMNYIAEELELSDAQRAEFEAQMKSFRESKKEGRAEHRAFRQQMMQLNPGMEGYQKQLDELVQQAQERAKDMVLERAEQQQALYAILTPEQRAEFSEMKQKMMSKGRHHHKESCDKDRGGKYWH